MFASANAKVPRPTGLTLNVGLFHGTVTETEMEDGYVNEMNLGGRLGDWQQLAVAGDMES